MVRMGHTVAPAQRTRCGPIHAVCPNWWTPHGVCRLGLARPSDGYRRILELKSTPPCPAGEAQRVNAWPVLDRVDLIERWMVPSCVCDDLGPNSEELPDLRMVRIPTAPVFVHAEENELRPMKPATIVELLSIRRSPEIMLASIGVARQTAYPNLILRGVPEPRILSDVPDPMLSVGEYFHHLCQLRTHHVVEEKVHAAYRFSNSTAAMTCSSAIEYQSATALAL